MATQTKYAPGTILGGGAYIGANGEIVWGTPGKSGGEVLVDGTPVEYTPPASTGATATQPLPATNFFPTQVPATGLAVGAAMTPVSLDTPGASPVATGFDLFKDTFTMLMQADAARRAAVDQQISLATLFTELERASPTRAADLAVRLGLPSMEPDMGFANIFGKGANATFGGTAGSQALSLPWMFSGSQISFLNDRPNVANVVGDISERFGRPDLFRESIASLIPTSASLTGLAF